MKKYILRGGPHYCDGKSYKAGDIVELSDETYAKIGEKFEAVPEPKPEPESQPDRQPDRQPNLPPQPELGVQRGRGQRGRR